VIKHLIPASTKRIVVYLRPISMRWGATKLRALCRNEIGIKPDLSTAFLFVNKTHDSLLLYAMTEDGDQTLTKKLDKGTFIVPTAGFSPSWPLVFNSRRLHLCSNATVIASRLAIGLR
jgi:hypothetical protein